jgi:hypothetical protein
MNKKKKNSARFLGYRTIAFALLALGGLALVSYAAWGILLSLVLSLNNQGNTSLMATILALTVSSFLALRFTWFNGKRLWTEWQSRQKAKRAGVEYQDFSHLEDNLGDEESDYLDMQSLSESSAKS